MKTTQKKIYIKYVLVVKNLICFIYICNMLEYMRRENKGLPSPRYKQHMHVIRNYNKLF